jgi:hypothetical protein
MWKRSRGLPHKSPRPAPPGVRLAYPDRDGPPDGWELIAPSFGERVSIGLDSVLLRMTGAAARAISRREFLRRTGELAVLAGLAVAGLAWEAGPASSHEPEFNTCNPFGVNPQGGACGPSRLCPQSVCLSGGRCNTGIAGVRRRVDGMADPPHWPGNDCGNDSRHHCWLECCPPTGTRTKWRCCDCCVNPNQCSACTSSCGGCTTKVKCICRNDTGVSCP